MLWLFVCINSCNYYEKLYEVTLQSEFTDSKGNPRETSSLMRSGRSHV